jgi:hypothetical protein
MPPIAPGGGGGSPPGTGAPEQPPGISGGAGSLPPSVMPPIYIPPGMPPVEQPEGPIDWKTAWTPQTGWIVVGVPQVPVPTPST